MAIPCDRLPFPLNICPVCGQGIKVTTGYTWIQPEKFFQGQHTPCNDTFKNGCPICNPKIMGEQAGLMWVGSRFYSCESFIEESTKMGVSKRIPFIPSQLKLGESWILLAHKEAGTKFLETKVIKGVVLKGKIPDVCPAIFYAFKPTRVEYLLWKRDSTEKRLKDLRDRGITPVVIPDGDKDHDPSRSIWTDLKQHNKRVEKK